MHEHLAGRYGTEAEAVLGLLREDPSLLEPLVPGLPYLRAEAVHAARHELAITLDDVLSRRTAPPGSSHAPRPSPRPWRRGAPPCPRARLGRRCACGEAEEYRAAVDHERGRPAARDRADASLGA